MKTILIAYASAAIIAPIIDSVWLISMSKRFYGVHLGHLMSASPNFVPIVLFYLIYAFALTFLVITPAMQSGSSLVRVFFMGALLGCAAYAAYDLTNHATLRDWPLIVTIVDMAWGTVLTGIVATIATHVTRMFS